MSAFADCSGLNVGVSDTARGGLGDSIVFMNSPITELTICPQSALLTALSMILFFTVPCVIAFLRNERIKQLFLWLAPFPIVLWSMNPQLCFHKPFENSIFLVLISFVWYLIGLYFLRTQNSLVVKSLCCLIFVAPMLFAQWVLWGFSIEVFVGTN